MIRRLEKKDAERMLEWMHDEEINHNFSVDFESHTLEDAINFIENSFDEKNQHFAVVDEDDIYQGSISLKNISYTDYNAEYAIVLRRDALGKGYSQEATWKILEYAFNELGLYKVYLNVLEGNKRARRFYEKMGFKPEGVFEEHKYVQGRFHNLCWYAIFKTNGEKGEKSRDKSI
ncbi:GNAT family N-acetyltransferase [Clostridium sp. C105KSO13]|uniref:GNAT family N-acetyltransferase n=1 Tax=Clostridium sp. C105KSO13 TaxID=1776045 RepID=UPI0007407126|nr:GNAT family protein [Clostridium sp. C105KSO13]CUX34493.1 Putative ribosomal N-acetyltransferase YdaF [Clostridium sp. C105KSO13]